MFFDENFFEQIKVKKRTGNLVKFNKEKIIEAIKKASESANEEINVEKITESVIKKIYSFLLKEETKSIDIEQIQDFIEKTLIEKNYYKIAKLFIIYRYKRQEEREAKKALIGAVSKAPLSLNAVKLLHDRYLLRKENSLETPDEMFERIAEAVAQIEKKYGADESQVRLWKLRFKRLMMNLKFLPSSNVLMSAGLPNEHLAASVALPIEDNLNSIFETLKKSVIYQKKGSGVGLNFSKLREKNSLIRGRKVTKGPLQFLNIFSNALSAIKQNGVREGANMAILNCDHPDIIDFVSAKSTQYHLPNFNISVALTKEFMEAVIRDETYTLKGKNFTKEVYAKPVFDVMVANAWNSAEPGVIFLENIKKDNNKDFCSTSACAEFNLEPYECGFNGSINLSRFVINNKIDYYSLKETIFWAVRFLDNLIDLNHFPFKESERIVYKNRKIGLGIMGFAHVLYQLRIPYDSEEAIKKAEEIASFLRKQADEASKELAKERGVFPNWKETVYYKNNFPLRNATRLSISPTGSISIIADCSPSIEPVFSLVYVTKSSSGKEYYYLDPYLQEALESEGLLSNEIIVDIANRGLNNKEIPDWIKNVFLTTYQIKPETHVKIQAAFQKYVDNNVSKTVNLPNDATLLDVENIFLLAYSLGCKGVTIYRDGSRTNQLLSLTAINQKRNKKNYSLREELKKILENKKLKEYTK